MMKPRLLAVSGGSGSGKTTLVSRLRQALGQALDAEIQVLHLDHYYLDLSHLSQAERDLRNFDHPDAFDMKLLREHLGTLLEGKGIDRPTYDFASHTRTGKTVRLEPAKVILLDGILMLHDPALRALYDLSVYVEVDDDVRIIRRLRRDIVERGRTMDSVIAQYLQTVKPMHDAYVAPQKFVADIIVSWMGYNDRAVAMLAGTVASWLKGIP